MGTLLKDGYSTVESLRVQGLGARVQGLGSELRAWGVEKENGTTMLMRIL